MGEVYHVMEKAGKTICGKVFYYHESPPPEKLNIHDKRICKKCKQKVLQAVNVLWKAGVEI